MCYRQAIEWKCPDCGKKSRENSTAHMQCPNDGCRKIQLKLRPQMRFSRQPCRACQPRKRSARNKSVRARRVGASAGVKPQFMVMDPFDGDDEMPTVARAGVGKRASELKNEMEHKAEVFHREQFKQQTALLQQAQEEKRVENCFTPEVHPAGLTRGGEEQSRLPIGGEHRALELRPRRGQGIDRHRDNVKGHHGLPLSASACVVLNNCFALV